MDLRRHNASSNSSERKRLRDRKAQQTLREKKEKRIRFLEDKIALCERHHGSSDTQQVNQHLQSDLEILQSENEKLRICLESLRNILHSLDDDLRSKPKERCTQHSGTGTMGTFITGSSALVSADTEDPTVQPNQSEITIQNSVHNATIPRPLPRATPVWSLIPMNETTIPLFCSWLSRPDLINTCTPHPPPLALLYGTRRNWLADEIHRSIRLRAIRDSECLAIGWLAYNYSKWRVSPSPASFARLTSFQQPTLAQLQHGHPVGIDLLPWPQLRSNLAENWHKYDYMELTSYLGCCMKVWWPWGQEILERDERDELQIRQEFFDVFTKEIGWGLTSEFIGRYPELLHGMDIESVRFQITVGQPC
ncbi:hypothetical protein PENSTE_c011G04302 [Penicillium steckii]|uniref:BZIP domain-containing protein n=1 Tax=Penicillium steckii TaxID=303698 RepID=A0A1V6T6C1_9EURO|nr:hypothetical protein PENSTE_c011G04302 [Penicillium steckii]